MSFRAKGPYIGITDVASGAQAERFLNKFMTLGGHRTGRRLMVGVMMSKKTLTGQETKWSKAWPKNEQVADIFIDHPAAMNTLHYADYEDFGINDPHSLHRAVAHCGLDLHAIQLDMIWPHPDSLRTLRAATGPDLEIILQIGTKAMELVGEGDGNILREFEHYASVVDHVLFDLSGGLGKPMDGRALAERVRLFTQCFPRTGIAVAGGLGPDTLGLLDPILQVKAVSIDAQAKLRPSHNAMDPLDEGLVNTYIDRSIEKFRALR